MQNCTESEQEQKRQAKLARASTRMREAKTKLTSEEIEQIVDRLLTLDDAQAIKMLRGHPNSLAFIEEYRRRRVTSGIEEALVLTGEFFYRDHWGEQSPE